MFLDKACNYIIGHNKKLFLFIDAEQSAWTDLESIYKNPEGTY